MKDKVQALRETSNGVMTWNQVRELEEELNKAKLVIKAHNYDQPCNKSLVYILV